MAASSLRLVEIGMVFDLVGDDRLGRQPHRLGERGDREVRDADMARQAAALGVAERAHALADGNGGIGPVDEQKVDLSRARAASDSPRPIVCSGAVAKRVAAAPWW